MPKASNWYWCGKPGSLRSFSRGATTCSSESLMRDCSRQQPFGQRLSCISTICRCSDRPSLL